MFGSVDKGVDGPESDIDLLVDIPKSMGLFTPAALEVDLIRLLGVDVDVVPRRLLRPNVSESAERTAVPL